MMSVKIRFFAYYRALFGVSEKAADLPSDSTIGDLLDNICDTPDRRSEIFAERSLRSHVVVLINGRPIDPRRGLEEPLHAGDGVAVFPFIGGG